jgi:hypothetical protein
MRLPAAALMSAIMLAPLAALAAPGDPAPSAQAWLTLIDHGRYGESWTASGTIFRGRITKARWALMVAQVRTPLGAVVSRTFTGDEPSNALPGAPDGAYDQIHFSTVFAHKQSSIETVVMAKEPGGWRVDGYFIR